MRSTRRVAVGFGCLFSVSLVALPAAATDPAVLDPAPVEAAAATGPEALDPAPAGAPAAVATETAAGEVDGSRGFLEAPAVTGQNVAVEMAA